MNQTLVWTRFAVVCQDCKRRFRITKEALNVNREHLVGAQGQEVADDNTDADVAAQFEFCMECTGGCHDTGEFIEDNPYARRWDPKGWAFDVLARMVRTTHQLENVIARDALYPATRTRLVRRLARCAFLAEALRDRIDGRC
jgi:hypothetical protein